MSSKSYLFPIIVIVIAFATVEVFCRDVSYARQSAAINPYVWDSTLKITTPWPALGQGRNNYNENFLSNLTWVVRPSTNQRQPPNSTFSNNNFDAGSQFGTNYNKNFKANSPQVTSGDVTDQELREYSEALLSRDVNNAANYVNINLQSKTTSFSRRDEAPLPLLSIRNEAFAIPSIEKILKLYNNYIAESHLREDYTSQEKNEEDDLLNTIISTPVMEYTRNFLIQKDKIGQDLKDFKEILREIWFNMYARGKGYPVGSSGFEHVFLAEIKKGKISGLHNWLYFNREEANQQVNYLGYMKKIDLGNKGAILTNHFTYRGIDKPVGSMFIGTSPELEMALYTTCFLLRPDRICPLTMNGNRFLIKTYTYKYRGKNMIGSAFPDI